jgi:hypothetical protein
MTSRREDVICLLTYRWTSQANTNLSICTGKRNFQIHFIVQLTEILNVRGDYSEIFEYVSDIKQRWRMAWYCLRLQGQAVPKMKALRSFGTPVTGRPMKARHTAGHLNLHTLKASYTVWM